MEGLSMKETFAKQADVYLEKVNRMVKSKDRNMENYYLGQLDAVFDTAQRFGYFTCEVKEHMKVEPVRHKEVN
jgi:hypothetical protein